MSGRRTSGCYLPSTVVPQATAADGRGPRQQHELLPDWGNADQCDRPFEVESAIPSREPAEQALAIRIPPNSPSILGTGEPLMLASRGRMYHAAPQRMKDRGLVDLGR
jgi:hypothetical protein